MLITRNINATILINQSFFCMINQYFCMINQFFCMINQKMVRHTENFWGSGSYSKTVRPNGFFIYRRFGSFTMPNIVISPEISTCEQNSTSPSHSALDESTQSLVRPQREKKCDKGRHQ